METAPKYPHVYVPLTGVDGTRYYAVIAKAMKSARHAGLTKDEIRGYVDEATKGNYDHLLKTTMRYFDTD